MIEQTDLIVTDWNYMPPDSPASLEKVSSYITLDIMRKSASGKKGLACRFSCRFVNETDTILIYVGEDSYVIDLEDIVEKEEILKMIRNSYSKFKEKFDFRKLGTILNENNLRPLDESHIELEVIYQLLN